jgi:hypothetical protein
MNAIDFDGGDLRLIEDWTETTLSLSPSISREKDDRGRRARA